MSTNDRNQALEIIYSNPFKYGIFGPAIILLAFGQATGELIHWPYLTIKYGLFFVFLIIPACLIQFPLFGFLARHTILSGESHLLSLVKINKIYALLTWVVFILTSVWISSYTSSGGIAIAKLYSVSTGSAINLQDWGMYSALAINTIFFGILLLRRKRYQFISGFMKAIAALSVVVVTTIFIKTISANGLNTAFFSSILDIKLSLPDQWASGDSKFVINAVIFAGLGGLWNILYSVWLRQEGLGINNQSKSEFLEYQSQLPIVDESSQSVTNYNRLMSLIKRDLWVGLIGNAIMILMITYIAFTSFPAGLEAPTGIGIITSLGDAVSYQSIIMAFIFYIFIGLFLIDTWAAAADSLSKLHANMTISLRSDKSEATESKSKALYVTFLVTMWLMTFVSSVIAQPQQLNYLNGLLSMYGSVLLIGGIFLIERHYRSSLKTIPRHPIMTLFLVISFAIYAALATAFVIYS